jgi:hypothetical protein
MAVFVQTEDPAALLRSIKRAIAQGKVRTWSVDTDGDFTHAVEQWAYKAWLRPRITETGKLVFNILAPKDTRMSSMVYAIFHGRFVEMLLSHFDGEFSQATATAMPVWPDQV